MYLIIDVIFDMYIYLHIYIYIYVYAHTHIYIYIQRCVCIYILYTVHGDQDGRVVYIAGITTKHLTLHFRFLSRWSRC